MGWRLRNFLHERRIRRDVRRFASTLDSHRELTVDRCRSSTPMPLGRAVRSFQPTDFEWLHVSRAGNFVQLLK